jgi:hypothetical protein
VRWPAMTRFEVSYTADPPGRSQCRHAPPQVSRRMCAMMMLAAAPPTVSRCANASLDDTRCAAMRPPGGDGPRALSIAGAGPLRPSRRAPCPVSRQSGCAPRPMKPSGGAIRAYSAMSDAPIMRRRFLLGEADGRKLPFAAKYVLTSGAAISRKSSRSRPAGRGARGSAELRASAPGKSSTSSAMATSSAMIRNADQSDELGGRRA